MKRFVLAAACAALLAPGCGGSNLVPTGGAESTEEGTFVPRADTAGTVAQVDNAGRLVLTDGRRVTLAGIDLSTGADVCADQGLAYLRRLTVGGAVTVDVCDTSATNDPTGMVVAATQDGRAFVNVEMLRSGFAQINGENLEACGDGAAQERLEQAQSEAQVALRGNFGSGPSACSLPPPAPEPVAGSGRTPGVTPSPSPRGSPFPTVSPFPRASPRSTATPAPLASPLPVASPRPIVSPLPGPSPLPTLGPSPGPSPTGGGTGGGPIGMPAAVR